MKNCGLNIRFAMSLSSMQHQHLIRGPALVWGTYCVNLVVFSTYVWYLVPMLPWLLIFILNVTEFLGY